MFRCSFNVKKKKNLNLMRFQIKVETPSAVSVPSISINNNRCTYYEQMIREDVSVIHDVNKRSSVLEMLGFNARRCLITHTVKPKVTRSPDIIFDILLLGH